LDDLHRVILVVHSCLRNGPSTQETPYFLSRPMHYRSSWLDVWQLDILWRRRDMVLDLASSMVCQICGFLFLACIELHRYPCNLYDLWIRVRVILHKAGSNPQSVDRASKLFTRFRLYLFSFLASWLFSIVNRLQNSISPASPQLWLYIVQATLEPLGGLWNMLAYGLHEQLVRRYSETFKKCRTAINVQPASNATELAVVPNPMKPPPSPRMARAQPPVVANPDEPEEVHQGFDPPGS